MLDRFFGSPTREKFAHLVAAGVRRAGERRKIRFDAEQFCLRPDGDELSVMNLANIYAEFCAADKAIRPKLMSNIVRSWFADRRPLPEAFEDLQPDLLPSVRSRAYFEFAVLQLRLEGGAPIEYPQQILGEHLAVSLVYDLPDSMRTIVAADLETWGVTFYEALEFACSNLRHKEDPVFISPHEGVYISATGDNYDASRLILGDMVHQFDVHGDFIAMAANRDTLIVTGSENLTGLRVMVARARRALEEPRPIAMIALRMVDDEWYEWLPPVDHPLYRDMALLRLQSLGQQHAEQKELLDVHHQNIQDPVSAVSFSAVENKRTGEVKSYCVWSEGGDLLLPKTDLVYFYRLGKSVDEDSVLATASWSAVESVLGPMLEPQDYYPLRFRVRSFPSTAQLRELNRLAKADDLHN